MGLLELRCNLIVYDTKTLVGADGRPVAPATPTVLEFHKLCLSP